MLADVTRLDLARVRAIALDRSNTRVVFSRTGKRLSFAIAVNPGLGVREDHADYQMRASGGVEIDDIEVAYAGAILAHRVQYELGEQTRLSLREWIETELEKRAGGKNARGRPIAPRSQLAADLLGLDLDRRAKWSEAETKRFKAEIRKLQEYTQAGDRYSKLPKYGNASGERRARIANLPGGEIGNPYAPDSTLWTRNLAYATVSGGALGDWRISSFEYQYRWKYTLPERPGEDPAPLHEAIEFSGDGLVLAIRDGVDQYIGNADRALSLTELLHVYGVVIDITLR